MNQDMLGKSAYVYLRKSRKEEGLETEEVLRKHREALEECAQRHGLAVLEWFSEVVSGESLYARPQMLRLLEAVEAGSCDAVLCMDLDRLSRGRMKDQGMILDAFRESGTLIVTPDKVYDLADESDDELAEFKTFMSRREYKIITKRLRRGLLRSIQEGCYVANAPYGYRSATVDHRPTLTPYEPEAALVREMFRLYIEGYGCVSIAHQITAMGGRPHRGTEFNRTSIARILRSPVYIGKVVWNQKSHIKKNTRGNQKHITIYNPPEKWTVVDGLHPAIIDTEDFEKVQKILAGRYHPSYRDGTVKSPLAGLVLCGNCGGHMQKMPSKGKPYLYCVKKGCCAGTKIELVEARILQHLEDALREIRASHGGAGPDLAPLERAEAAIGREIQAARRQKERLHELLELGEYDLPTYRERMAAVMEKLSGLERAHEDARRQLEEARAYNPALQEQRIQAVLDAYEAGDAAQRNALLKSAIQDVYYYKAKKTKPLDFTLEITLRTD